MWFTGKGDKGTSSLFGSSDRIPKSHMIFEALGTLDELNSFVGFFKSETTLSLSALNAPIEIKALMDEIQNDVFTIQAEVASAEDEPAKFITEERVERLEELIKNVGEELPTLRSFVLPGANRESAFLDVLRVIARKAERRIVEVSVEKKVRNETLAYLNRLSSVFFILGRLAVQFEGGKEEAPTYNS